MLDFFTHLKIKRGDLPYMLVYMGIFAAVIVVGLLTAEITTVILIAICCLPVLILLLHYHFFRSYEAVAVRQQQKYQAYFSLFNLIDFRLPIPYMTSWAATPELALAIYEIIRTKTPGQIVELGSGISSLICCYGIEKNGQGALFSLDHDKEYANRTREMLRKHEVDQFSTIVHTPLVKQTIDDKNCTWYDCSSIDCPKNIDLLIVDGPPFKTQTRARYPALPYFYSRLSPSATIVIHDALRDEESAIIDNWVRTFPEFEKESIHSEKGITILRR